MKFLKKPLSEEALHFHVAAYLSLVLDEEKTLWTTIENSNQQGGKSGMIKQAKLKKKGVLTGYPDILIQYSSGKDQIKNLALELKAPKGRVSDKQLAVHDRLMLINCPVEIARSIDDVAFALKIHNVPRKKNVIIW